MNSLRLRDRTEIERAELNVWLRQAGLADATISFDLAAAVIDTKINGSYLVVCESCTEHPLDRVGLSVLSQRMCFIRRWRDDADAKKLINLLVGPIFDDAEELKVFKMVVVMQG